MRTKLDIGAVSYYYILLDDFWSELEVVLPTLIVEFVNTNSFVFYTQFFFALKLEFASQ